MDSNEDALLAERLYLAAREYYLIRETPEAEETFTGIKRNPIVDEQIRVELFAALVDYRIKKNPFGDNPE